MFDCLFYWFFEFIIGLSFDLLVWIISIRQIKLSLRSIGLELLQLAFLIVEVEYEVKNGFILTIFAYLFVNLLKLAHLSSILVLLLIVSSYRYTQWLVIWLFLPLLALLLRSVIISSWLLSIGPIYQPGMVWVVVLPIWSGLLVRLTMGWLWMGLSALSMCLVVIKFIWLFFMHF